MPIINLVHLKTVSNDIWIIKKTVISVSVLSLPPGLCFFEKHLNFMKVFCREKIR